MRIRHGSIGSIGLLLAAAFTWSEPARGIEYTLHEEIAYQSAELIEKSEYAKQQCLLDFYHPKDVKGFPTIVFFHGGGLTGGSRQIPKELKERGWGVVGVGYRLSPQATHPAYIEDAAASVAWTFKNVESYGGDPKKIFVMGISAGGYLTAMIGLDKSYLAKHEIDADRIAGLLPVTGQMITHATVRKEQGVEQSEVRPTIDKYAPLFHIRADAPPTLCVTGGWEVDMRMRAEENLYFVSMMKLVGHRHCKQIVIEGADHGRCGRECWPHVVKFIEQILAGEPSDATAK